MVRRPTRLVLLLTALALAGLLAAACRPITVGGGTGGDGGNGRGPKVTINQIQVLASHNSYHVEPEPALLTALRSVIGAATDGFEYTHRPLAAELDAGVRQVELDVFVDDPGGGRYAHPKLVPLLGLAPIDPALARPGLKVLHVQEVDYRSTCPTFVDCLQDIRNWSRDHPGHLPITIQVEAKDDVIPDPAGLGFVQPLPWTAPAFATLEAEIRSIFGDKGIISPGDVKGRSPSLAAAVRKGRWPTLAEARGQIMFVLDDKGAKRDAYRAQVPDVDDRLIFVDVPPGDPDAAVTVVNDPIGDAARIRDLVTQGFIVRTRADADTVEARSGDTTRRDAAFASGAQYVSTDYVFPDDHFGTGYVVDLPGTDAARCNPVNAPKRCQKADLSG
jgi:Phosphoinositide phospholipase C, Ca2+-dependent